MRVCAALSTVHRVSPDYDEIILRGFFYRTDSIIPLVCDAHGAKCQMVTFRARSDIFGTETACPVPDKCAVIKSAQLIRGLFGKQRVR